MDEVALDLDPAMVDNMRREADDHEFEDLDGYVQWLLERRDTILNEYDVWEDPPGAVADPDADLAQSSGGSLSVEDGPDSAEGPSIDPALDPDGDADAQGEPDEEEEDVDLPEEDGADDDDVAAALEDLDLEE
jgi:hypothetical protein